MALFWKKPPDEPIVLRGVRRSISGDWYHLMLRAPWWFDLVVIAGGILIVNLLFACAYVVVGGVAGAHSFSDLFFFSVQTMGTIGYGSMYPQSFGAHVLTTGEAIAGVFVVALATGLLFSKFSMLRARVRFATKAVICPMNGTPTLMLRIGHERSSQVINALIHAVLSRSEVTDEGVPMYRMYDLVLVRDRAPALSRAWTVMHKITNDSPLFGMTAASMAELEGELLLTLSGVDETSGQMLHARHTYEDKDILWNERHADMLSRLPDGRLLLDMDQFDRTTPAAAALTASAVRVTSTGHTTTVTEARDAAARGSERPPLSEIASEMAVGQVGNPPDAD